jgi:hypothetical protein
VDSLERLSYAQVSMEKMFDKGIRKHDMTTNLHNRYPEFSQLGRRDRYAFGRTRGVKR